METEGDVIEYYFFENDRLSEGGKQSANTMARVCRSGNGVAFMMFREGSRQDPRLVMAARRKNYQGVCNNFRQFTKCTSPWYEIIAVGFIEKNCMKLSLFQNMKSQLLMIAVAHDLDIGIQEEEQH